MKKKIVSILIPCKDEIQNLERCLNSIIENKYPKDLTEIFILDGLSNDGTFELAKKYEREYSFINVFINHNVTKSAALNLGIKEAKGDIVIRMDTHAIYPSNYISKLVKGLEDYNADNIGGIRNTYEGNTLIEKAISILISHPFSVGNTYWRTGTNKVRQVDTVYCGCYRKKIFESIGTFNEDLIRAQDREFNFRLKEAGGKIILDPSIEVVYYPRDQISDFLKWNFDGAFWLFYANKYTDTSLYSWRNFVPLMFTLYVMGLIVGQFFYNFVQSVFITPLLIYLILDFYFSISEAFKAKKIFLFCLMSILFLISHLTYGVGGIWGLIKRKSESLCRGN